MVEESEFRLSKSPPPPPPPREAPCSDYDVKVVKVDGDGGGNLDGDCTKTLAHLRAVPDTVKKFPGLAPVLFSMVSFFTSTRPNRSRVGAIDKPDRPEQAFDQYNISRKI